MGRTVTYNTEARDGLKRGVDILANAVKVTLGPKGRNVIIDKQNYDPIITKDGVTVARDIYVNDPLENIGAQMVKQVARKTAEIAGDGTTTATVLAQSILTLGIKYMSAGANPMDLKKGVDKAVIAVVESLKKQSETIGDDHQKTVQVATISANGDKAIGKLISDAVKQVGRDGVITIEESNGSETTMKIVDGMVVDRGFISPFFITNMSKAEVEFINPLILMVDKKIRETKELIPILEKQVKTGRPMLIICEDLEGEALKTLVMNKMQNKLIIAAIKLPGFGDMSKVLLQDIAIRTGGIVISETAGLSIEKAILDDLGRASKIIIDAHTTTILNGEGNVDQIKERSDEIRILIDKEESDFGKSKLRERLAKISASVAVLYIGAATEVEMKERMDRVDDALHATRAALEEGIVAGGGVALIRAIADIADLKGDNDDENMGIQIIRLAMEEPMRQICLNSGIESPGDVILKVKKGKKDFGYNARTDKYEPLIKAGVIDPTKVTRVALENAASIASMLLTTECVLSDESFTDEKPTNKR